MCLGYKGCCGCDVSRLVLGCHGVFGVLWLSIVYFFMRFVGVFFCLLIRARFVCLRNSESVFSIICCAVSSLHFNLSCWVLCSVCDGQL